MNIKECVDPKFFPVKRLKDNEVHLWYAFPERVGLGWSNYLRILSEEEKSRFNSFHFERDRLEFLIARYLTRTVLSFYVPEVSPVDWEIVYNQYGKPELANEQRPPWLHFNISHSGGLVACALSGSCQLGIDIEVTERHWRYLGLAESVFSRQEINDLSLHSFEKKGEYFYKIWTLKEAYIKAKGMGLSIPLDQFTFSIKDGGDIIFYNMDLEQNHAPWKFELLNPTPQHQVAVALQSLDKILVTENFFPSF